METPVLSKLQKKKSLTGKKNKKEVIKNVLVDPHKTNWPLVQNELEFLSNILKENLPQVKPAKINVPWRLLKDISRDKRKEVRADYIQKQRLSNNFVKDDNLIFGVNQVTKHLECDLCSVVLVQDVIPRTAVKHIVEMAILKDIPVLVISTLKKMLKDFCGLESLAFAIKRDFKSSANLKTVVENLAEIYKNYTPSENHVNSIRCKNMKITEKCFNEGKQVDNVNKLVKCSDMQEVPNYHLDKMSSNQRAFVPEGKEYSSLIPGVIERSCDPFKTHKSQIDVRHQVIKKKIMKKLYKPLTVKRLKGNKNRHKDKSESSKTRK